ncbi:hypothetical protein ASF19_20225 [Acidovorax sp. Leaf84]|uniref:hypothetical protein n=1 Tax=Acidovorax sp. Leaf84 TaxID=1736240 RepID=UPI000700EBB7|nr:hypothetical protein [Acidovorax sp. Leaf84]KQO38104.1 hypothetical protein ASF19_20225 [Acidovorax sp. Leaf84]
MRTTAALIACMLTVTGCASPQACALLDTALSEAQMAEAWYLEAGKVLQACGIPEAMERADSKACYARRFNNTSVECE